MSINEAVEIFGSKSKLARALGVTPQAVTKWGDELPPLRVYQIKEILADLDATQPSDE